MMRSSLVRLSRQRGVAVVTALLLTTLAITIVASLFWQQQVQVRSIENQRLQLQKQWILRGALDWSRLILREDARHSQVDHLGEPWAVPLAETRLDQYVDNARAETDVPDAALSGGIVDAQSRFNLTNLVQNGQIDKLQVAAFAKLLTNARLNPQLAMDTAKLMAAAQPAVVPAAAAANGTANATGTGNATAAVQTGTPAPAAQTATAATATSSSDASVQPINILNVDDLLAVQGFTPEALASIKDFLVVLPKQTPVNVNTAPAEVLAAIIGTLSPSDAAAIVSSRERTYFRNTSDFQTLLQAQGRALPAGALIDVRTNYFLVNGNVRLSRAGMQMQALIERNGASSAKIIWIREN